MAIELDSSSSHLARGSVGTLEAAAQSISGLAPTMGMAFSTSLVAVFAAGAAPLSFVIAAIASFALCYAFVVFAKRGGTSGVAYTYVGSAFGRHAGFTAGWVYAGGWVAGMAVTMAVIGTTAQALFAQAHIRVGWFLPAVVSLIIMFLMCLFGIRPALRAQLVMEGVSVAFLFFIACVVLSKGGAEGLSFAPLNPSLSPTGWSGIFLGAVLALAGFIAFEGATALGLESRDPTRAIPRALWAAVGGGTIIYLFVCFSISIGYGPHHGGTSWAKDPAVLDSIATRYVGHAAATTMDIMVLVSAISAGVAITNLAARVGFGMARTGMAPKALLKVHPRFKTPYVSLIVMDVIGFAIAAAFELKGGVLLLLGIVTGTNALGFILVYMAVSAAAAWAFGRSSATPWQYIVRIGVPAVALGMFGFMLYRSVVPVPAFPYNLEPYLMLAWIVIGLTATFLVRKRSATASDEFAAEQVDVGSLALTEGAG